jgi:hypothetical protein
MNKRHIVNNLAEAADELNRTVAELRSSRRITEDRLYVALQHLYHHINFAWNGRHSSASRSKACSARDFRAWGQYPRTIPPLGSLPATRRKP